MFSALLAINEVNLLATVNSPDEDPVICSFDVLFITKQTNFWTNKQLPLNGDDWLTLLTNGTSKAFPYHNVTMTWIGLVNALKNVVLLSPRRCPAAGCVASWEVMINVTWCCTLGVLLPHWGRDKMATIFQTTLSSSFSCMKIVLFWFQFHWNLFLRVQLTIIRQWFR